jgi:hypothetical protein
LILDCNWSWLLCCKCAISINIHPKG